MAYREVTMLEVKEVLRLWVSGVRMKRIAAQLGLNIKTVRRYLRKNASTAAGVAYGRRPPLDAHTRRGGMAFAELAGGVFNVISE